MECNRLGLFKKKCYCDTQQKQRVNPLYIQQEKFSKQNYK